MMGLNVKKTKMKAYVLSSFLCSIGGICYCMNTMSASVAQATGLEMDAIASSVIGGTLLTGGCGKCFRLLLRSADYRYHFHTGEDQRKTFKLLVQHRCGGSAVLLHCASEYLCHGEGEKEIKEKIHKNPRRDSSEELSRLLRAPADYFCGLQPISESYGRRQKTDSRYSGSKL